MKKRLVVLVAMLLCVVMALSACTLGASKVLDGGAFDAGLVPTTATKVDYKGSTDTHGDLVKFTDTDDNGLDTVVVYNLATGTEVFKATETKTTEGENVTTTQIDVTLRSYEDISWFYVVTTTVKVTADDDVTTYAWSLRDAAGAEFAATTTKRTENVATFADLISFGEKVYRITEEKIEAAFDRSDLAGFPEATYGVKMGKYYLGMEVDMHTYDLKGVTFYDEELNVNGYYNVRHEENSCQMGLSNGNLLFQYIVEEPDTAEEWDYVAEGKKYSLITEVVNAKNGEAKDVDCEYILSYGTCFDADNWAEMGLSDKVENIAYAQPIVDGRPVNDTVMLQLSNSGKVKGEIEIVKNEGASEFGQVAADRWIVETVVGSVYVVDAKGKVIGNISDAEDLEDDMNQIGFVYNDYIYDWNMEKKFDLFDKEMEVEEILDNGFILEDKDGALLYMGADFTTKELIAKDAEGKDFAKIGDMFAIKEVAEGKTKWTVYNSKGETVTTFANATSVSIVTVIDDAILVRVEVPAEGAVEAHTEFYRLTAAA